MSTKLKRINVRVSPSRYDSYQNRAAVVGMQLSEWIRFKLDAPDEKENNHVK